MLKKAILFLAIPALFATVSCGDKKKGGDEVPGMSQYDLSSYGAHIVLNVPDTTKTKLEVAAQSSGSIEIKSGKDFQISVTPGEGDFALKKSDISSDEVKKFKRFVIDEPTALIWESQVSGMESEFHFYTVIKAGKDSYLIEDIKDGDSFNEAAVRKMMEAAKSAKAKESPATNS